MNSIQPLVYHRVCSDREHFSSTYVVRASDFRRQMLYLVTHGYCAVTPTIFRPPHPHTTVPGRGS
jgi:hypothetical protein